MKKLIQLLLLTISFLLSPIVTVAEETKLVFEPRVMVGLMQYDQKGSDTKKAPILGIGVTFVYDRFFLDAYIQESDKFEDERKEYVRQDQAIALGYAITEKFSISMGYRNATTEYNRNPESVYFYMDHSFKAKGPFIGGAYGWILGNGLLGFNFALAYLKAEVKAYDLVYTKYDTTVGAMLGITWKTPLTEKVMFGISLDAYHYKFDKGTYNSSFKETLINLKTSLSYRF